MTAESDSEGVLPPVRQDPVAQVIRVEVPKLGPGQKCVVIRAINDWVPKEGTKLFLAAPVPAGMPASPNLIEWVEEALSHVGCARVRAGIPSLHEKGVRLLAALRAVPAVMAVPPLTDEQIDRTWRWAKNADGTYLGGGSSLDAFTAAVRYAEHAHGIGAALASPMVVPSSVNANPVHGAIPDGWVRVGTILSGLLRPEQEPWCKEVLLYSPGNAGDSPENRVMLYAASTFQPRWEFK